MQKRRMYLILPGLRVHRDLIEAIALYRFPGAKPDGKQYCFTVTLRKRVDRYASSDITLEESIDLWKYIDEFLNEEPVDHEDRKKTWLEAHDPDRLP